MDIFEKRGLKIWGIVFCSVICYVMLHRVLNEVDFQRFSNIFVGFIEVHLNQHLTLDYFNIFPIFNKKVTIDPSFPYRFQRIMGTESYYVLITYLFIITHLITNLSPQLLIVIPLGVLFLPIIWLAVIRAYIPLNNKPNIVFCILLAIYYLLYVVTTKAYGSFYVSPPSSALFLLIFLCIYRFFYSKNNKGNYFLIMVICYISLTLYWHTLVMSSLYFVLALFIILGSLYIYSLMSKTTSQYKQLFGISTSIAAISIVASFTFIHLWQSSYVDKFIAETNLWDFITKAIMKFQGGVPFAVPYSFNYKNLFFGSLYFKSLLIIHFLAMLLLVIPIILNVYYIKTKGCDIELPLVFSISIFFAQIIHVISYYQTKSLSFFYVPLYFPLFGIQLFANTVKREDSFYQITKAFITFSIIIMIILSLICVFSIGNIREAGETSVTKYIDTENSFNWIYSHHISNKVIVDFNILGKYLQRESYKPELKIEYIDLNVYSYSYFLGDNNYLPPSFSNSYLIIDHATMEKGLPIHITEGRTLISSNYKKINSCKHQNKIYDDDFIAIYQIRKLDQITP